MFALQKRLYAWEIEQARAFKVYVLALVGLFLFVIYRMAKMFFIALVVILKRPRLIKQIEPGKFEEVQSLPKDFGI